MKTNIEQVVAKRDYPSTLLGHTPNDTAYWFEPGLPWASETTVGPSARRGPARRQAEFIFTGDEMAPRFPEGTLVGLEAVHTYQELEVGRVYVHLRPTGADRPQVGRLAHVGAEALELTQDNHPTKLVWALPAKRAPFRHLYVVTHYSQYLPAGGKVCEPMIEENGLPAFLLEVTSEDMAPRYPLGARYISRLVPTERWGTARGVHALALADGRQLVRRIQHLSDGVFTLISDRTGDTQQVALAEVTSLWKLGFADYLPEESDADCLWWLQRGTTRSTPTPVPAPPPASSLPGTAPPPAAPHR